MFLFTFCSIALYLSSTASADTGDIIDDALPAATGPTWCAGMAGAVWADVDADGTYDTQVVLTTLSGEAAIEPEFTSGKWYFHSFIDSHCGGSSPYHDRGRFRIHFIDILAPGFVWDDPATWVYKSVPALSLRLSNDTCYAYDNPIYDDPAIHPVHSAHAYRETGQTDSIGMSEGAGVHNFSDPGGSGIKELNITTDFCESIMDDLVLCDDAASPNCGGTAPAEPGVALVFDVSGSMGWAHDGTMGVPPEQQRLTFAKGATSAFLTTLNDNGGGIASFGIAAFPNHPQVGCNAEVITPMTLVDDSSVTTATTSTIPGLNAQGSTPLLAGLGASLGMFTTESPRAAVLLSDGYHNCPSTVTVSDAEVLSMINSAVASSTKVYTIGFGRPTDIDHPLLDAFATETGGAFHDVTGPSFDPTSWDPSTALAKAYTDILADALELETGLDPLATLLPGKSLVKELAVNEYDSRVSVIVTWRTQRAGHVNVALRSSDGASVPHSGAGIRYTTGDTYTVWTLDRTFLSQAGKVGAKPWQLEMRTAKEDKAEPVHYTVLMDSGLKLQTSFGDRRLATGVRPKVSARLSAAGKPVLGAQVRLIQARPTASAGSWLAQQKAPAKRSALTPKDKRSEGLSPLANKLRYIVDELGVSMPKLEHGGYKLYDDGTHGDSAANDGIYTASMDTLRFDGRYAMHFEAMGKTDRGNPFRRESREHRWIAGQANSRATEIQVTRSQFGKRRAVLKVQIVPKDRYGNHLGPNLAGFIKVQPSWGKMRGEVKDNLDGSYTQSIDLPVTMQEPVKLNIEVRGVNMKATWSPDGPSAKPPLFRSPRLGIDRRLPKPTGSLPATVGGSIVLPERLK